MFIRYACTINNLMNNIFELSPFVCKQFNQFPELKTLVSGELDLDKDWNSFKKQNAHLDVFSLPRLYRQSRLALIATRDIQSINPIDHIHTLKLTSQLAKLMIQFAYDTAAHEFELKHGKVLNNQGSSQNLLIFALGKLGGNELNYSSDVDLVFCYTGNGISDGKKPLDAQNYFNRLGRRIIQILDAFTKDGIVYRVDMRLRPFGSAAPLVCSCSNLLNYLETEGRDWERYAWLRASFITGNKDIADETLKQIQPFIYRKYLDYNIFESLRQIKAQIARKQTDDKDNIKLGIGGIREIEFIVQTLQLTFAGRNKQLRGNDLWQRMHDLKDHNHLSVKKLKQLTAAWLFLRKLENLCQIIHDSDSHHLPKDANALAICMHYENESTLIKQLNKHRKNVNDILNKLFISNSSSSEKSSNHADIQLIKDEISEMKFPKSNKHKMYAALDVLVPYLNKTTNEKLLQRYQRVVYAVSKRPNYLSMLIESPLILEKLIQQLTYSNYFCNAIIQTPSLLEILFDGVDGTEFSMAKQWHYFSKKFNTNDEESFLEILCQFKQRIQFKAILSYVDQTLDAKSTCGVLSDLAEYVLSLVIKLAWDITQEKSHCHIEADDLIVIAYGSMAVKNMHLNSDFDLVFILDHNIDETNHQFVMRWIKRIVHLLSVKTYSGSLYQLDTQLRPNGKSGAAIVTQSNFEEYQRNQAWLWEHAALIKSRAVFATKSQNKWYENLKGNIINQKRNPETVDKALNEMTTKLNQASKKDHQIEFKVLGSILKQAHDNPGITNQLLCKNTSYQHKLDLSILNE